MKRFINALLRRLLCRIVIALVRPEWVVFNPQDDPYCAPELGLMVWGVVFALHKGKSYTPSHQPLNIRAPGKREFGESLHPTPPAHVVYTEL